MLQVNQFLCVRYAGFDISNCSQNEVQCKKLPSKEGTSIFGSCTPFASDEEVGWAYAKRPFLTSRDRLNTACSTVGLEYSKIISISVKSRAYSVFRTSLNSYLISESCSSYCQRTTIPSVAGGRDTSLVAIKANALRMRVSRFRGRARGYILRPAPAEAEQSGDFLNPQVEACYLVIMPVQSVLFVARASSPSVTSTMER